MTEDITRPTWSTVSAQKQEIDRLMEQVHQLKEAQRIAAEAADLDQVIAVQHAFKLSPLEARILIRMEGRRIAMTVHLMRDFFSHCNSDKGVHVYMHRLRKKGFEIQTHWGHGYSLTETQRAKVRAVLQGVRRAA